MNGGGRSIRSRMRCCLARTRRTTPLYEPAHSQIESISSRSCVPGRVVGRRAGHSSYGDGEEKPMRGASFAVYALVAVGGVGLAASARADSSYKLGFVYPTLNNPFFVD